MYKPCRQMIRMGDSQKTTMLKISFGSVYIKGGMGSKLPKILSTWFVHGPLLEMHRFISPEQPNFYLEQGENPNQKHRQIGCQNSALY